MSNQFATPAQVQALVRPDDKPTNPWWTWFQSIAQNMNRGISTTVALAKITGGGTDGSLTVVNGIITAYTAPT